MCQAKDVNAEPRSVGDFEDDNVFVGNGLIEHDGEVWIGLGHRVPVREIRGA
jgi:hypothetical protein